MMGILVFVLDHADRLETAGYHDRNAIGHDPLRCHTDSLQTGTAETVDRHAAGRDRQAGTNGRLACDVVAGCAFRHRAAQDHILDVFGLHASAVDRMFDHVAAERGTVSLVERAAVRLAIGVRAVDTMTASVISFSFLFPIPVQFLSKIGEAFAMVAGVAEQGIDHREPLEVMPTSSSSVIPMPP